MVRVDSVERNVYVVYIHRWSFCVGFVFWGGLFFLLACMRTLELAVYVFWTIYTTLTGFFMNRPVYVVYQI